MVKLKLLSAELIAATMLAVPAVAREQHDGVMRQGIGTSQEMRLRAGRAARLPASRRHALAHSQRRPGPPNRLASPTRDIDPRRRFP